ncbi:pseudouridine synthase [Hymenobacter chitinivorans]|uniref:Pseudouridine synthase n=1 Tax=Hymenobacter chitinivorans DSM 11115 TaxID=1121954 RepID=A0A2M9BMP8_9BACT|nr:pseudouridine synthase [Hymenobacter chitinivorans]PJJ59233.1 23S rRNA pseudouridine2457 synthase [Hymenobacter chitinivorans DSM 11115]
MRYVLVNKPFEVLTQFTDENGRATLKDFVPVPGVYPVGRLDYDSEGLVLLTDDKGLQHRLSEPRYKVPKTYLAQVEGVPTEEALAQLRRGVDIKTSYTAPAEAELLAGPPAYLWERSKPIRFRAAIPTSWLKITISQGMNRQVRKMTAAVGFPTLRLIRTNIAHLPVDGLAPGQWRELTEAEAAKLRSAYSATKMPGERAIAPKSTTGATKAEASVKPAKPAGAGRSAGPKSAGAGSTGSRPAAGKGGRFSDSDKPKGRSGPKPTGGGAGRSSGAGGRSGGGRSAGR